MGEQAMTGSVDREDRPSPHQEQLRRLRRMQRAADQVAAAQVLERRADRAATPLLASLLRERAGERRCRGEQLLTGPPEPRAVPPRPPGAERRR